MQQNCQAQQVCYSYESVKKTCNAYKGRINVSMLESAAQHNTAANNTPRVHNRSRPAECTISSQLENVYKIVLFLSTTSSMLIIPTTNE